MGMDNSKIKDIVTQAKGLINGESDAQELMSLMVKNMTKSLNLAVGIIDHLREKGVDLLNQEGEIAEDFREKFRPQIEKLGEREFAQIRKISEKLFN